MKITKDFWIILGFALLHAGVALGCRVANLTDEMILTLLTMLLVVILCLRSHVDGKMMAISVVLVNIVGVLLGRGTAWLFGRIFTSPLAVYPLSTFVSTLVIGWISCWAARRYGRTRLAGAESVNSLRWLFLAFVVRYQILAFGCAAQKASRLSYSCTFRRGQ